MLAALLEDPGLISSTHVECLTFRSRGFNPLFWYSWAPVLMCTYMCTVSCMPEPRHTDINSNLETLVYLLCTAQEEALISSFWKKGSSFRFVPFWKEQATVANFCTHWSVVYRYFCLDEKALPAPTSPRHWLFVNSAFIPTSSTPYTFAQSSPAPHTHTQAGMHIHRNNCESSNFYFTDANFFFSHKMSDPVNYVER